MSQDPHALRVFVSSTSEDLKEYRGVARNVILDLDWHPQMMEHWTASPDATVPACIERLKPCQLVVLLIAWRRGWVPTEEQGGNGKDSITALELAYARENHIPVLALFADDDWPGKLWDREPEALSWLEAFRNQLNQVAVFFAHEKVTPGDKESLPAFRAKLKQVLLEHRARLLAQQQKSPTAGPGFDFFERARRYLLAGKRIPFVGAEVNGEGPLSSKALLAALRGPQPFDEHESLATAAEYRERYLDSREEFLELFRETLEAQQEQAEGRVVHDLLSRLEGCPLLVSVTHDQVLEKKLEADGKEFALVTHVQRPLYADPDEKGEHDGKVVVLSPDGEARLFEADKMELPDVRRVIYKPLGSPFLNDRLEEELEVDTVVVTERDHLIFLSRLDDQHAGIPVRFRTLFLKYPPLFLGYALDAWHYRLVMNVFQAVRKKRRSRSILAVRIPDTPMEEMAWRRLGADLIQMETDDFARQVLEQAQEA